ncbi:MAG: ankyrin repeat domain-containing protein [Treponema sp.]|nr:ankyrin repeat domain-containing protein [Treponema sp.]
MTKLTKILSFLCILTVFSLSGISCKSSPPSSEPQANVWLLLSKGDSRAAGYFHGEVDVNAADPNGKTALHYAAERKDAQLVRFFISIGANVNALDHLGQSPLGISILNNDPVVTQILAAAGSDIHMPILNNTTAALTALNQNNSIFKAILTPNNLDSTDNSGKSVSHLASINGNVIAVQDIINVSVSSSILVNKRDNLGKNSLDYALERPDSKNHMEIAEQLTLAGAFSENPIFGFFGPAARSGNYNIRRNEGLAPIHYAVIGDYVGLISFLITKNIDLNIKSTSGATALHEAVRIGNIEVITMLVNNGADVNAKDAKGNTPLHTGIPSEVHREVVTLLLQKGADPNLRDEHGDTPLHIAVMLNRAVNVVQAILNGGSDVNIRNIEGKTPLFIAIQDGRTALIPVLLSYGSEIFAADNSGTTPFDVAIRSNENIFNLLITSETVNQRDSEGNTMLHTALKARATSNQISRILDQRASVDARNRDGDTALHFAVRLNQRENGEFLISKGANIFSLNSEGKSPLYIALSSNPLREWIINSVTIKSKDGLGNNMLHYAAEWSMNNVIPIIIRSGIHVDETNATGQTPLFMAIKTDSISTIRTLTGNNANLNVKDNQGNTVLHAAVRWNAINSASLLISSGIDINASSLNGNTPLHDAVALGMSDIETLLIRQKANLEARNIDGNTPLMEAVRGALIPSIEKLIQNGSDPSARNTRGDTPLHVSVSMERYDIANILLKTDVSIHARNTRNRTPFQIAIGVSPVMVSALLTSDRINTPDDMGSSALHIALHEGASADIIRTIVNRGARINIVDSNGKTPLRVSIDLDAWESAKIIADAGADPFITAVDNKTPVEISFSKGNECIKAIFSGRMINVTDSSGNSVLHFAARYGTADDVRLLLEFGANKSLKNVASESAYDIALRWNRRDNAEVLRIN